MLTREEFNIQSIKAMDVINETLSLNNISLDVGFGSMMTIIMLEFAKEGRSYEEVKAAFSIFIEGYKEIKKKNFLNSEE